MSEGDLSGKQARLDQAKLGEPADHWHLHAVCIKLPTDFEPYGFCSRDDGGPDCSCGCRLVAAAAGDAVRLGRVL